MNKYRVEIHSQEDGGLRINHSEVVMAVDAFSAVVDAAMTLAGTTLPFSLGAKLRHVVGDPDGLSVEVKKLPW